MRQVRTIRFLSERGNPYGIFVSPARSGDLNIEGLKRAFGIETNDQRNLSANQRNRRFRDDLCSFQVMRPRASTIQGRLIRPLAYWRLGLDADKSCRVPAITWRRNEKDNELELSALVKGPMICIGAYKATDVALLAKLHSACMRRDLLFVTYQQDRPMKERGILLAANSDLPSKLRRSIEQKSAQHMKMLQIAQKAGIETSSMDPTTDPFPLIPIEKTDIPRSQTRHPIAIMTNDEETLIGKWVTIEEYQNRGK